MKDSTQKKYKDTIFRMLFKEPKNGLSLYNGLNGTAYTDTTLMEYNTLENAIYMSMKNDLSFVIAHQMSLYEHQSTMNPNMPLRDLFYVAELLQKLVKDKSIYSSGLIKIPAPQFIVFYNGAENVPEKMELRLSDAFETLEEDPALELVVTVLNINAGMNEALKEKCPVLGEYMYYVDKVRNYAKEMELKTAVELAIQECISENVLRDFLMEQRAEVTMLSIFEYDEERELKLIREDEREIGKEIGKEIGRMEMLGKQVESVISLCEEFGCSMDQLIDKLMEQCVLSREEAVKKYEEYKCKQVESKK